MVHCTQRQLHKVRLQLKKLREYLTEVAGRAALSTAATKSEKAEAAAVMEFKPLTEEERLALEQEQAEEKRRQEEEDRNDPDQPVGDPRLWRPRAVVKWFLASKVAQYVPQLVCAVLSLSICKGYIFLLSASPSAATFAD